MKKYMTYLFLTLLLISTHLFAAESQYKVNTVDALIKKGVIRVAMYKNDTPPFYFSDEAGELKGIDVEIIKGFAKKLNIDVEFIRTAKTINETVDMVSDGRADLAICKLSVTFDRAKRVLFTEPYINLRKGLLINRVLLQQQLKKRSKQETIQNLEGKVGIINNSSYIAYAKQRFKKMTIVHYDSWQDIVDAVLTQKIIAGFRDEVEIKKIILDNKNHSLTAMTVVLEDDFDPKGIALPHDAYHLKVLLDFYVKSLGVKLTANNVLFEYDSIVKKINRL